MSKKKHKADSKFPPRSAAPRPLDPPWYGRADFQYGSIVIMIFIAYGSRWQAGFIWDDDDYITGNLVLRSLDGLRRIWFDFMATPQYYPLVHTTFWIEYHLWGLAPLGYHLDNIALHAANAVLLFILLQRLAVSGAWIAAAIFAVHPVCVVSVAW